MRLLTRRLYRAFPELDPYTDEQCRRFMRSARRGRRLWFAAVTVAVVLVGLGITSYAGDQLFERINEYQNEQRRDVPWLNLVAVLALCPLIAAPFGAALVVRDWMMRRRVRVILSEDSSCPRCRYRLLGLSVDANSTITCPECGLVSEVDPSLSELTLDEHGKQQLRPVIVLPPPPPLWKRRGVRIAARVGLVLILLPLLSWAGFVGWVSRQRSLAASAEIELAAAQAAYKAARLAKASGTDASQALVLAIRRAVQADHAVQVDSSNYVPWGGPGPSLSWVLKSDGSRSEKLGVDLVAAYRTAGVFKELREIHGAGTWEDELPVHGPMYFSTMIVPQSFPGSIGYVAEINLMRLELARRAQDREEFLEALESSLALARLMHQKSDAAYLIRACEVEAGALGRVRAALAGGVDGAWLKSVREVIARQRAERLPELVLEGDRLASQLVMARMYLEAVGNDASGGNAAESMLDLRRGGLRLGSFAENRDRLDLCFREFETLIGQAPYARGAPAVIVPSNLGPMRYAFPEQRYKVVEMLDRNALDRRAIDVLLALEEFRLRYGRYPGALEEVVPEFLGDVPVDPWSGRALGYRLVDPAKDADGRAFLLYSVGQDRTDNGGLQAATGDPEAALNLFRMAVGVDYVINPGPKSATKAQASRTPDEEGRTQPSEEDEDERR